MKNLIYIFVAVVTIKFLVNSYNYYRSTRYLDKYIRWVVHPGWELTEQKHQVIKLFKDAGLKDSKFPYVRQLDLNHVATSDASIWDNFPSNMNEIFERTKGYFHEAIGVYRTRALEAFNPFYWIEFIIYFPKQVLNHFDVSSKNIIDIFQLIYWAIAIVSSIFYMSQTSEINMLGNM